MMASADGCEAYRELFTDLLDGELEGPDAARIEDHVSHCQACTREFSVLKGLVGGLKAIPEEDPGPTLVPRVMALVRQETWVERLVRVWSSLWEGQDARVLLPAAALGALVVLVSVMQPGGHGRSVEQGPQIAQVPAVRALWLSGSIARNGRDLAVSESGREPVKAGDELITAAATQLHLAYADGTTVFVPGGTRITLGTQGLVLFSGQVLVKTGHPGAQPYKVQTPNATVVDVGTHFRVTYGGSGTMVEVYEGAVRMTSSKGRVVDASAGNRATVDALGSTSSEPLTGTDAGHPARTRPEDVKLMSPGAHR